MLFSLLLAAGDAGSIYIGFGLGAPFSDEAKFSSQNDVFVEGEAFEEVVSETIELTTNNRFALSGFLGWQFHPNFAIEAEHARQSYRVDDENLDDDFDTSVLFGFPNGITTLSLSSANFVLSNEFNNGHRPYLGIGVGLAQAESNEDQLAFEDDSQLGYQIKAGLVFALNGGHRLGIQGRYIGTERAFERTFERAVTQPGGAEIPTQLTETWISRAMICRSLTASDLVENNLPTK